ncbi:hypothetical protein WA026_010979, partial [Henosepilachna vigintioctopunctata]
MWTLFILWLVVQRTKSFVTCRSEFCPPILKNDLITIDKGIAMKLVGIDERAGCSCRELPKVYTMCYNTNDKATPCIAFPKRVKLQTTGLLLKSTFIKEIRYGDFENLASLEFLALDANQQLS